MAKPEAAATPSLSGWTLPIVLIGCGNMAGAILGRWLACGLRPSLVQVVDPAGPVQPAGVAVFKALPDQLPEGCLTLLGIKPQLLGAVAADLNARLDAGRAIMSMLAGVPIAQLRAMLPAAGAIVRIMPNLPVRSGDGVVLTSAEPGGDAVAAEVLLLLGTLGLVEPLDGDGAFDLATAVSGCGPAFVYRFIETLAQGAADLGMDGDQALRLARQTVAGAALSALASDVSPAAMADAVASPGGMTRLGLDVMDADGRMQALMTDTLRAARDRGAELARMAQSA